MLRDDDMTAHDLASEVLEICKRELAAPFDGKKLILKGYLPGDKCGFLERLPLEFMKVGDKK